VYQNNGDCASGQVLFELNAPVVAGHDNGESVLAAALAAETGLDLHAQQAFAVLVRKS